MKARGCNRHPPNSPRFLLSRGAVSTLKWRCGSPASPPPTAAGSEESNGSKVCLKYVPGRTRPCLQHGGGAPTAGVSTGMATDSWSHRDPARIPMAVSTWPHSGANSRLLLIPTFLDLRLGCCQDLPFSSSWGEECDAFPLLLRSVNRPASAPACGSR